MVKEYTEKISGAKKVAERQALSELLEDVEKNQVKKILVFECSRLSRRALDFLSIIEQLNEKGVSVFFYQNGLETLLPDGKVKGTGISERLKEVRWEGRLDTGRPTTRRSIPRKSPF